MISEINKEECDAEKISRETKSWVALFTSTYQSKDVTPYIHTFRMHVPKFIKLYGSLLYIIPSHSRVWKSSMIGVLRISRELRIIVTLNR